MNRQGNPSQRLGTALRTALFAVLAGIVLVAGSAARGAAHIPEIHQGLPDLDTRTTSVAPTAAQLAAAEQLGADASWNQFGTPSSLYNLDGYLARDVQAADAAGAARAFLDANAALFNLSSAADLELVRDTPLTGGTGHVVLLGQTFDGVIAAPDGLVTVAVTGSQAEGWDVTYSSSTLAGSDAVATDATLSPEQAWVRAARAVGKTSVSEADVSVSGTTPDGWTELTVAGFDVTQSVRETAFPIPGQAARAAYQTVVTDGKEVGYVHTVDGQSGAVLTRNEIVDYAADNPAWKVFEAYPPFTDLNAYPWGRPSTDTRRLWCWTPAPGCDVAVGNPANAAGVAMPWDQTDPAGPPSFTTSGNNANSREQWISQSVNPPRPAGTLFQPTSPTRDYVYPWTNQWFESQCNPAVLGTVAAPNVGANDISAATANLFAMHNRMHDWSYHLGFTEDAWNAQANNFGVVAPRVPGLPVLGNDPLTGNAQAAAITGGFPTFAGRDNANMGTRPDGTPSVTNMFLWQPIPGTFYAPCVDGDYDMSVIAHEYGHMIENRMIGKGNIRAGADAGAMGEAFGDLAAMAVLNAYHVVPEGVSKYVVGPYVTGNPDNAIRNFAMNWDMSGRFPEPGRLQRIHGVNLGSVEYDFVGQQVHSDGEIWSGTNYTLRNLFLNRYPARGAALDLSCAAGETPVDQCPGDRRWIQLYFDAMLLMPPRPSFLIARDAILAADQTRFGGANQDILWRGFAEKGFGRHASQALIPGGNPPTPRPGDDPNPIPDFSTPYEENAVVTFRAFAEDGTTPVNARIFVGDYEARATQIADTNPATVGVAPTNMDDNAPFVATGDGRGDGHNLSGERNAQGKKNDGKGRPRRGDDNGAGYNFIATAPGKGTVRFRIDDLEPGEQRLVTIEFPTNHAATANGATATGDGGTQATPQNLLDGTEATNWSATGADVAGRYVMIDLGGRKQVKGAQVSAMLVPGNNRFVALRQFQLLACDTARERQNPTCNPAIGAGWKLLVGSGPNAFPSVNPRPIVPSLILRSWDTPRAFATHVLFRVLTNQCTGQPSFQGEQDLDPQYTTDCRITVFQPGTTTPLLPERDTEVRAAEVQLLSGDARVTGAETKSK